MKAKEVKTLWKVAKQFWISSTAFWLLETIVFLIHQGWHIKATNPIEIYCDKVVVGMWTFALYLTVYICWNLITNLNFTK